MRASAGASKQPSVFMLCCVGAATDDAGRLAAGRLAGGVQVLHVAVLKQRIAAVQALLDLGFPCMHNNSRGWLPLDEAVALRHRQLARNLEPPAPSSHAACHSNTAAVSVKCCCG